MDLELVCACGTELRVEDVDPVQIEHIMNVWHSMHPHDEVAAFTAATSKSRFYFGDDEALSEEGEDDGRQGAS